MLSPLVQQLIDSLRCLNGVGPKSAQRMAFQLLERHREAGLALAQTLVQAMNDIRHCQRCRSFTEADVCHLCSNSARSPHQLCIVETAADIVALEQTSSYQGLYFVLMGHLSPLDGIGPDELGMDDLMTRIDSEPIQEVILATNPTVEGEATAHYIATLLKNKNIRCSRIAHGVPLDGELGYLDTGTLARALSSRTLIEQR
jgi:recombination protein RecR